MVIEKLKSIYDWINGLDSNVKTVLLVLLIVYCFDNTFISNTQSILKDYVESAHRDKIKAEAYTQMITPQLNNRIDKILQSDENITNVLLLNCHNTITSTHGLEYLYLTALTEKVRGIETQNCFNLWKELSYTYYGEEFEKISNNKYLNIDNVEELKKTLPRLSNLLIISNAKHAAFYSIEGENQAVGMVLIFYKKKPSISIDYYQTKIAPNIQVLSSLLDYNSIKRNFNENEN